MTPHQVHAVEASALISLSSTLLSFFITTLPVVQWLAAGVGFLAGALAVYRFFRNRK